MFCAPSSVERVSETWCQICRRNILLRSPEFYTLHGPVDFVPYAAAAVVFLQHSHRVFVSSSSSSSSSVDYERRIFL